MDKGKFLELGQLKLEYYTYGTGKTPLLAFHGFGRHAKDYKAFETLFGEKYTIYAFNLFHHGVSEYPEERISQDTFTKHEFKQLFAKFFSENKIEKTAIMGYSLGGKIALMFTEFFFRKSRITLAFCSRRNKKEFLVFHCQQHFNWP